MRFKVGDKVRGKKGNPYNITSSKSVCQVVKVREGRYYDLIVRVIKHETSRSCIGNEYEVESRYFVPHMTHNYIEV